MIVRVGVQGRGCGKRNMSSLLIDILCFVLIQNLCQFIKLLSIELFSGCCFDLFVTCSVQINEL